MRSNALDLRTIAGQVDSAGNNVSGTPGVTTNRASTGVYNVNLPPGFRLTSAIPYGVAAGVLMAWVNASAQVITASPAGASTDCQFRWTAAR